MVSLGAAAADSYEHTGTVEISGHLVLTIPQPPNCIVGYQ